MLHATGMVLPIAVVSGLLALVSMKGVLVPAFCHRVANRASPQEMRFVSKPVVLLHGSSHTSRRTPLLTFTKFAHRNACHFPLAPPTYRLDAIPKVGFADGGPIADPNGIS